MRKLLLIDDDPATTAVLGSLLAQHGFDVSRAPRLGPGVGRSHDDAVALLVGLDGDVSERLAFVERLRSAGERRPIVALSGLAGDQDAIRALKAGADDYVVRPFNHLVLVARLESALRRVGWRRVGAPAGEGLDAAQRTLRLRGRVVPLTVTEYRLLEVLTAQAGKVFPRDALWTHLDADGTLDSFDRAIDLHMSRLRAKLEANPKEPRHLLTVRGVGYRFEW